MREQLLTKTFGGMLVLAGVAAALGIPLWGFAPLVLVGAAFFVSAAVHTILFPPEK